MPVKLRNIGAGEIKLATIDLGEDGSLNFYYRAGRLTPKVQSVSNELFLVAKRQRDRQKLLAEGGETPDVSDEDRGEEMAEVADAMEGFVSVILDMVASWDILDDEGKPLPVTRDIVESIPFDVLSQMFSRMMGDNSPNARSVEG